MIGSMDLPPAMTWSPARARARAFARERAQSTVEYVGLAAISATLVTGIAAAIDSVAGDRLGAAIARRLLELLQSG